MLMEAEDLAIPESFRDDLRVLLRNLTLALDEPDLEPIYQAKILLVRPDQHVCWRANSANDNRAAQQVVKTALGLSETYSA